MNKEVRKKFNFVRYDERDDPDGYGSSDPIDYYQLSREVSGEARNGY